MGNNTYTKRKKSRKPVQAKKTLGRLVQTSQTIPLQKDMRKEK
jgi:hypothetical protein